MEKPQIIYRSYFGKLETLEFIVDHPKHPDVSVYLTSESKRVILVNNQDIANRSYFISRLEALEALVNWHESQADLLRVKIKTIKYEGENN